VAAAAPGGNRMRGRAEVGCGVVRKGALRGEGGDGPRKGRDCFQKERFSIPSSRTRAAILAGASGGTWGRGGVPPWWAASRRRRANSAAGSATDPSAAARGGGGGGGGRSRRGTGGRGLGAERGGGRLRRSPDHWQHICGSPPIRCGRWVAYSISIAHRPLRRPRSWRVPRRPADRAPSGPAARSRPTMGADLSPPPKLIPTTQIGDVKLYIKKMR